jgi:hypothetical protein
MPMPEPPPMGAHVEIVEPYTVLMVDRDPDKVADSLRRLPAIKPRRVRINGTDVGIVKPDSVVVDVGDDRAASGNRPCTVTLTLVVKSVEIKAE